MYCFKFFYYFTRIFLIFMRFLPAFCLSLDNVVAGEFQEQLFGSRILETDGCLGVFSCPLNSYHLTYAKTLVFDDVSHRNRPIIATATAHCAHRAADLPQIHPALLQLPLVFFLKRRNRGGWTLGRGDFRFGVRPKL